MSDEANKIQRAIDAIQTNLNAIKGIRTGENSSQVFLYGAINDMEKELKKLAKARAHFVQVG